MKMFHLAAIIAAVAVVTIGAELAALSVSYLSFDRIPWVRGETRVEPESEALAVGTRLRLSPYYGYMGLPGMKMADVGRREDFVRQFGPRYAEHDFATARINNHGFLDKNDYPYSDPTGRSFVIGVFGGSVAIQFATTMEQTLNDILTVDPRLAGRRVVLLDFANGGAKQPQQVTSLAYFLSIGQHFDLIINLDGFNELFIGWMNAHKHDVDERMPFARFIFGVQNVALESYGVLPSDNRILRMRVRLNELTRKLAEPQSALLFVWRTVERNGIANQLAALETNLSAPGKVLDYAMPLIARSSRDDRASLENVVETWFNASVAMAGMARQFGVPYLHVLQPNQYFTKARFTDDQRKAILNLAEPPLAVLVPDHYRAYLGRARDLQKRGIKFLDGTTVLDEVDASVFIDNCCHFNEEANKLLAKAISQQILEHLRQPGTER
jgi:hypothetical protein